jgi:UDP-N-acetylglucosamine diphosphorylase / glucose-1-phosphate thymidylyltransferase / UDP-N-acetylgalactosamine diphosphorylase / glucosamine-1-phosphate N-acetyltransferase / galactosamine-1-phosphate N-acetyltransferase
MKCVILAAGEGKRMHPLTFTRPKVMLPVANKPILEWNLLNAKKAGLKDFIFVVGYKSEMVRNYFLSGENWGVNIEYVNQGKPRGTGHAVGMVESFVKDFLVLCGDTVFGVEDLKKIKNKSNSMGLFKVERPEQYGIVETKDDRVVKIFEKMKDPFTDVINAGIYNFKHSIFDYIKKTSVSKRGEYELTDAINMMAEKNKINSVEIKNWRDIVYPWDLLDANKEILEKFKNKSNCEIEKNVTIKDNVVVGENTQILNGTYIEGPCVIGKNCKIGPNCYIRPFTAIGDNCHVGNACEIKNSIVFDNSNIPHHNYVGDSVIGSGCNLGSGTKIANLRLDKKNINVVLNDKKIVTGRRKLGVIMGDNVQTGVNSMFDVGSIVGNNVFVGPGAMVAGEVKPKSKFF